MEIYELVGWFVVWASLRKPSKHEAAPNPSMSPSARWRSSARLDSTRLGGVGGGAAGCGRRGRRRCGSTAGEGWPAAVGADSAWGRWEVDPADLQSNGPWIREATDTGDAHPPPPFPVLRPMPICRSSSQRS